MASEWPSLRQWPVNVAGVAAFATYEFGSLPFCRSCARAHAVASLVCCSADFISVLCLEMMLSLWGLFPLILEADQAEKKILGVTCPTSLLHVRA